MHRDRQHRAIARTLRPLAVKLYAESRGWIPVELESVRFWLFRHPEVKLRQLQIPMDSDDVGFVDAMLDMVHRIAEVERRAAQTVLEDLQSTDADVLRVRVASPASDTGQLSLSADVELREGARRALLAAACSVINPARYHPRLSRSEADALLAACRAGQTEIGSYIVKIICPLHAVEHAAQTPFTRLVTSHLMRSTAKLVHDIEQGRLEDYQDDRGDAVPFSANLCDALLRMRPEHDSGQIELSTQWAADRHIVPPKDIPTRVSIKAEYFPEIEQISKVLHPSCSGGRAEQLIGTVEQLSGAVGPDGRRMGEVMFTLLKDNEQLRARATLDADQYEVAMAAHERGDAYVVFRGLLHRGARVSRIEQLQAFELLSDAVGSKG